LPGHGGTTLGFASGVDLAATLLAAARAPIPATYQGFDLLAPLRKPSPGQRGRVCVAATDLLGYGLVTHRWKLLYYPNPFGSGRRSEARLFDLAIDPSEHTNLWQTLAPAAEADAWAGSDPDAEAAAARAGEAWAVQRQLVEALLRWRARQDDLAQMWAQVTRGATYVGSFTAKAFALLENATGFDAEVALQADCAGLG
jgi:arylsulfatase A-like enzyme